MLLGPLVFNGIDFYNSWSLFLLILCVHFRSYKFVYKRVQLSKCFQIYYYVKISKLLWTSEWKYFRRFCDGPKCSQLHIHINSHPFRSNYQFVSFYPYGMTCPVTLMIVFPTQYPSDTPSSDFIKGKERMPLV